MTWKPMIRGPYFTADLVVFGPDDDAVLIAILKGGPTVPETLDQLVSYLNTTDPITPFGLLADPRQLRFFRADSTTPALTLATGDVLRRYDADFRGDRISVDFLKMLLMFWMNDLRTHWNSDSPPASDAIAALGLLPLLAGSSVESEVDFAAHRVRRD